MRRTIEHINAKLPKTFVIAGNVATPKAGIDLENWGADATKVDGRRYKEYDGSASPGWGECGGALVHVAGQPGR